MNIGITSKPLHTILVSMPLGEHGIPHIVRATVALTLVISCFTAGNFQWKQPLANNFDIIPSECNRRTLSSADINLKHFAC